MNTLKKQAPATERLFVAHCATGIFFCDKSIKVDRDFKRLAHIFYSKPELEWDAVRVDPEMRVLVLQRAEQHIEKLRVERLERIEIARSHLKWRISILPNALEEHDQELVEKERKRLQRELDTLPEAE